MGGANNALAFGVGATEYAALVKSGFTFLEVPEAIRFELRGALRPGVTAKDVMLHILAHHAKRQETLDRVMEFGGPGLASLSPDERATLAKQQQGPAAVWVSDPALRERFQAAYRHLPTEMQGPTLWVFHAEPQGYYDLRAIDARVSQWLGL